MPLWGKGREISRHTLQDGSEIVFSESSNVPYGRRENDRAIAQKEWEEENARQEAMGNQWFSGGDGPGAWLPKTAPIGDPAEWVGFDPSRPRVYGNEDLIDESNPDFRDADAMNYHDTGR